VNAEHLINVPPSHGLTIAIAFLVDFIVLYGALRSWLVIRSTARPCICDRAEGDA
jgi:hypothetical protein